MWIVTHHSGRPRFRVILNENGSAVDESDFHGGVRSEAAE